MSPSQYPRPDFQRHPLRWELLNGPWDFLFDDEDVGLSKSWQHNGLPDSIELASEAAPYSERPSEADSVTQRIAAGTQELLENNDFSGNARRGTNSKQQIQVPFVFQSLASGINDRGVHEVLWYERVITDPRTTIEKQQGKRVLVRFGAVDYEATVWVNGRLIGSHRGGHVPFDLDATDALDTESSPSHRLTVRIFDSAYDLTQLRGKQYWGAKPESIFYTPSGGIWQSVWIEVVPEIRIGDSSHGTVLRSDDIRLGGIQGTIVVQGRRAGQACKVEIQSSFAGIQVAKGSQDLSRDTNSVKINLGMRLSDELRSKISPLVLQRSPLDDDSCWRDGLALWSPEHPLLYDIKIRLLSGSGEILDEVETYVGMRSLNWTSGDGLWRLNDKPYFQALCLDQGYWPDTLMTPPSSQSLKIDIEMAKRMGLNGCRKHQKVEDPLFYYWADKLGYLVWAEMANAYAFSQAYVDRFNQEWTEAVKLAINHPSVVTWTPVNESWGYPSLKDDVDQRNHIRALYFLTKTLDPTRSVNDNCGWEHVVTDISTFHDYSDGADLEKICASLDAILGKKAGRDMFVPKIPDVDAGAEHQAGVPIMCTEFGGVNIALAKPDDESREWGYTTAKDSEDLLQRIGHLVRGVILGGHCCAFVYTQLTDIEQEVNGLYTFDRKEKLDSGKVKAMIDKALQVFYSRVSEKEPK